jgi:hypothetical protein
MVETTEKKALTRGKLLKRAGAGAAILYSAPVLTSSAHATHGGRHTCGRGQQCAGGFSACRPQDNLCLCAERVNDHRCSCIDCIGSPCANFPGCAGTENCPAGWDCVLTNCTNFQTGICVPRCDSGAACPTSPAGAQGGARLGG